MLFPTWGQVTHVFLTLSPLIPEGMRSTCMPNPCRQRSFWARIKLSVNKFSHQKPKPPMFFLFYERLIAVFILNYIFQSNFLIGYIALFNFQTTHRFWRLPPPLRRQVFNLTHFPALANHFRKFSGKFFFKPTARLLLSPSPEIGFSIPELRAHEF